ncbi:hypothetical protein EJV47_16025 [Hymenobacter gummosus]|uniref:Uncharacterized protein n=1 Tax=Hymenobacter gummosus TaxID=1776032 RepID=A0A431U0M8_9BACT|nr:hypothetical protein [Hymenobacter gummosus]RTQ48478.1 hypothetical protein EJV47_16025 [Hymenobacter gummosus]
MYKLYPLLAGALLAAAGAMGQSVGVGNNSPATTAILDVSSTTKGMLVPRMTSAQRTAIGSPAQGLLVYQTDGAQAGFYYNASATSTANWLWLPDKTSAGDNLGSHTATTALKLAGNTLSNNGTGGISVTDAGNVTVTGNNTVTGNESVSGSLAIGTASAAGTAALEINSTTKGLLFPRMTQAQRTFITTPEGLVVYQTDGTPGLYQRLSTGWASLGTFNQESKTAIMAPTTNVTLNPGATTVEYTSNGSATANGTVTLGSGVEGQRLVVVNNDTQYLPLVSASGTGNILPGYAVRFIYTNGAWRRES